MSGPRQKALTSTRDRIFLETQALIGVSWIARLEWVASPVEVVQAPLPGRHGGVLICDDHRGGREVAAGQPPPGPALPGLPVRDRPRQERRQAAGAGARPAAGLAAIYSSFSGIDSMLVARSRSPSDGGGAAAAGQPPPASAAARRRGITGLGRLLRPAQRDDFPCLPPSGHGGAGPPGRWQPGRPGRPGGRGTSSPSCPSGWPTGRRGPPRPAAAGARAAARRRTAATVRLATGLAQQFLGGLVGEGGDLALGRQPVPPQDVPLGWVGGVLEEDRRRSRRSARITHLSLCLPPRPEASPGRLAARG